MRRIHAMYILAALGIGGAAGRAWAAGPECEMTLEGALTGKGSLKSTSPPNASVFSDYWLTEDSLRTAIRMSLFGGSAEEKKAKVDKAMKADPKMYALTLTCFTGLADVGLMSEGTTYKEMPRGPGKYKIPATPKDKGLLVTVSMNQGAKSAKRDGDGTLEIASWDGKHIAGTITLPLSVDGKKAVLKARFDYPCGGDSCK